MGLDVFQYLQCASCKTINELDFDRDNAYSLIKGGPFKYFDVNVTPFLIDCLEYEIGECYLSDDIKAQLQRFRNEMRHEDTGTFSQADKELRDEFVEFCHEWKFYEEVREIVYCRKCGNAISLVTYSY